MTTSGCDKEPRKAFGEDTQQGLLYIIKSFLLLCSCAYSFPTYNAPSVSPFPKLFFSPQWPALHFISFIRHTLKLSITILFPFSEHVFHIQTHKTFLFLKTKVLYLKSYAFVIFLMKYLVLDSKTASSMKYLLQKSVFF